MQSITIPYRRGCSQRATAWASSTPIAKLFDEAGGNIEVEEVDTEPVADRFWISIYGPLPSQAVASPAPAQPD